MLTDRTVWKKWASRDRLKPANWAPLPEWKITPVLPTGETWRYTTKKPNGDWMKVGFDAADWQEGRAGFGTDPPGFVQHTEWKTADIWLRREIVVPQGEHPRLQFLVYHDEDVEIFINGIFAAGDGGFTTNYVPLDISRETRAKSPARKC